MKIIRISDNAFKELYGAVVGDTPCTPASELALTVTAFGNESIVSGGLKPRRDEAPPVTLSTTSGTKEQNADLAKDLSETISLVAKEAYERDEKLSDRMSNLAKGLDEVACLARRANNRLDERAAKAEASTTAKAADAKKEAPKSGLEDVLASIRASLQADEEVACACGCGLKVPTKDLPPELVAILRVLTPGRIFKVSI